MSNLANLAHLLYLRIGPGKSYWHQRFYRPSVSLIEGTSTVWLEEKGLIIKATPLAALDGHFSGRCNIWLSGPSTKQIKEPLLVSTSDWMAVNGSPRFFSPSLPKIKFYHVNDTGFVKANLDDFIRFACNAEYTIVDYRVIFTLMKLAPQSLTGINFVIYDCWAYPLKTAQGKIEQLVGAPSNGAARISKDSRLGLPTGGTVAYTGAQALAFFGYSSLFFYGLDLSNTGRSYEEKKPQPQMLNKALENVIIPSFLLYAKEWPNVALYNCNPNSWLPNSVMTQIPPDSSWQNIY